MTLSNWNIFIGKKDAKGCINNVNNNTIFLYLKIYSSQKLTSINKLKSIIKYHKCLGPLTKIKVLKLYFQKISFY